MPNSPSTLLPISRDWQQYLVKAVLDETSADWPDRSPSEILDHEQSVNRDYECGLFALPAPIALLNDVKEIVTVPVGGKMLRLYPPFPLNEKQEASAAFADIEIPQGIAKVDGAAPIPSDAVTGVRAQHSLLPNATWARGLRVDIQTGVDVQSVIDSLLDHICQYTRQWWVRGTHNPFLGFSALGCCS